MKKISGSVLLGTGQRLSKSVGSNQLVGGERRCIGALWT